MFHYVTKCSCEVASTEVEFEVGKGKLPLSLSPLLLAGCEEGGGSEIVKMHLAFLPAKLSLFPPSAASGDTDKVIAAEALNVVGAGGAAVGETFRPICRSCPRNCASST